MICPEHKTYLGVRPPRTQCYKCWFIWLWSNKVFADLFKELGGDVGTGGSGDD